MSHHIAAFNPAEHRSGKWLKFNLATPDVLKLLVVDVGEVKIAVISSKTEVDFWTKKAKQSSDDGRFVGIFIKGGFLRVPGGKGLKRGEDGEPITNAAGDLIYEDTPERRVRIPDSVAPQRAIEVNGHRNLEWKVDGEAKVHTMLIPLEACADVELLLTRDDIPTAHNATLDPDFDPKLTARL